MTKYFKIKKYVDEKDDYKANLLQMGNTLYNLSDDADLEILVNDLNKKYIKNVNKKLKENKNKRYNNIAKVEDYIWDNKTEQYISVNELVNKLNKLDYIINGD